MIKSMFKDWQLERLKNQWGKCDSLEQFAIVHLEDKETHWDWYFLSISPDETVGWAIIDGPDLEITQIELDLLQDINYVFLDGIKMDNEFLPTKADLIWKTLNRRKKLA